MKEGVHTEGQTEEMAEMVADAVVDNITDNTAGDVKEKQCAVRHLFTEASMLDIVTPPGTPANVIIQ